jgi:2-keto-4-pentenoate hydratase/2-oxohepta-3-ene-1,7-dioic acid hydratase in catechol pathway
MKVGVVEYSGRNAPAVIDGSEARIIGPWAESSSLGGDFNLASLTVQEFQDRAAGSNTSIPLVDVSFVVPAGPRAKLICVGLNYRSHVEETRGKVGDVPSMFTKVRDALVGQGEPIYRPKVSECFDFEGEIAVVIGKSGRHIAKADAMNHVFGYTIMMDGSVRDYLLPTAGKNFWRSGALGPWIVTADEIPDPEVLRLETRLSGNVVQEATANMMIFSIPTIIEYISRWTPLAPGDVIATGTPAGIGSKRTPPLWMKEGDVIEVEVSHIGMLSNPVRNE